MSSRQSSSFFLNGMSDMISELGISLIRQNSESLLSLVGYRLTMLLPGTGNWLKFARLKN